VIKDGFGAALTTDGTGAAVSGAPDGRFVLAVVISGETDVSHWTSGDFGITWTRVV